LKVAKAIYMGPEFIGGSFKKCGWF